MPNLRCLYISFNKIDDNTLKKSDVYQLIASKPTHIFNRDTGRVEINEERLMIDHRVADDSTSIFEEENLFQLIALTFSSGATLDFILRQQKISDLIMSDTYFFLGVGIMMFLVTFNLRRNNLFIGIVKTVLLSIGIGLFLGGIYT